MPYKRNNRDWEVGWIAFSMLQKATQGSNELLSSGIGRLATEGRQHEVKNFNPVCPHGGIYTAQ